MCKILMLKKAKEAFLKNYRKLSIIVFTLVVFSWLVNLLGTVVLSYDSKNYLINERPGTKGVDENRSAGVSNSSKDKNNLKKESNGQGALREPAAVNSSSSESDSVNTNPKLN